MANRLRVLVNGERYLKNKIVNSHLSHEVNALHVKSWSLMLSLEMMTHLSLLHELKLYKIMMISAAKVKNIWK